MAEMIAADEAMGQVIAMDLEGGPGTTNEVDDIIRQNHVVMFSKTTCPFCFGKETEGVLFYYFVPC